VVVIFWFSVAVVVAVFVVKAVVVVVIAVVAVVSSPSKLHFQLLTLLAWIEMATVTSKA
jgi:hypothetical protein